MSAGELQERLAILTSSTTQDAIGGDVVTSSTLATVWGNVRPLSTREQLQAQAIGGVFTYVARIRYRADIVPAMKISWTPYGYSTPKTLEIHGVQPDPDDPRAFLLLQIGEGPQ